MAIRSFFFEPYQFAYKSILQNPRVLLPLFGTYLLVMALLSYLLWLQIPAPVPTKTQVTSYETKEGMTISKTAERVSYEYRGSYGMLAAIVAILAYSIYTRYLWSILAYRTIKGETATWREVFSSHHFNTIGKYYFSQILFYLKFYLKTLLLIIPGIYHLSEQYFVGIPLLEKPTLSLSEDCKQAQASSLFNRLKVLLFALLNGCLQQFFLAPVTAMASVYLEVKLRKK